MSPPKILRPDADNAEPENTANLNRVSESTAFADLKFDQQVVSQMNKGLWEALFDGDFKLAVRCDSCGHWLVASASKRRHRGPRCAAKAGDDK